jgi:hypothetical protein
VGKGTSDRIWWRGVEPDHLVIDETAPELYDAELEPKGWNRASFDLNTHPLHPAPNVTQDDLLIPSARDRLTLLGACLACGGCIAILWVYFPLFMVRVVAGVSYGRWLWLSMLAVAAATGLILFLYASAREKRYPDTL